MLAYCDKLTNRPAELTEGDLEELRRQGFDDEGILAVVLVAGFFALATRLADALGVELDPALTRGTKEYQQFLGRSQSH